MKLTEIIWNLKKTWLFLYWLKSVFLLIWIQVEFFIRENPLGKQSDNPKKNLAQENLIATFFTMDSKSAMNITKLMKIDKYSLNML